METDNYHTSWRKRTVDAVYKVDVEIMPGQIAATIIIWKLAYKLIDSLTSEYDSSIDYHVSMLLCQRDEKHSDRDTVRFTRKNSWAVVPVAVEGCQEL